MRNLVVAVAIIISTISLAACTPMVSAEGIIVEKQFKCLPPDDAHGVIPVPGQAPIVFKLVSNETDDIDNCKTPKRKRFTLVMEHPQTKYRYSNDSDESEYRRVKIGDMHHMLIPETK